MGKKRALRKRLSLIDKFEAESKSHVDEVESIHEDEEEIIVPMCPYLTSIITILVGSPSKEFNVHLGVISESRVLASKCQALCTWQEFSLPDVDAPIFELALCYMYGKDYKDYFSPSNPPARKSDAKGAAFKRHSLVYCFARKYELDGLNALATKNIKDLGQVDYQSVFWAAKEAYKRFPDDESWFRDCFRVETRRALRANHELFRESWILDTIAEGNGNFSLDLFTAMADRYEKIISRVMAMGPDPKSSPSLSRWFSPNLNRRGGTSSINSCSTDWEGQDTDFEINSATDATSGDEIIRVEQSPCVEDYTPGEESPCFVEEYPDVEQRYPIEDAAITETSYPAETAVEEEIAEVLERALLEVGPAKETKEEEPAEAAPAEGFPIQEMVDVLATALAQPGVAEEASERPQIETAPAVEATAQEALCDKQETLLEETSASVPQGLADTDAISAPTPEADIYSSQKGPQVSDDELGGIWGGRKSKKSKKSKKYKEVLARRTLVRDDRLCEGTTEPTVAAEEPAAAATKWSQPLDVLPREEALIGDATAVTQLADIDPVFEAIEITELRADADAFVEDAPADPPEDIPYEPDPEPILDARAEPEPATDLEPEPIRTAGDPPCEVIPEPFFSFLPRKKVSNQRKKARVIFPPDPPSDTDIPSTEPFSLHRDDGSPSRDELSLIGRRYATAPVSRYARVADAVETEVEAQPEISTCTSRGRHLANESRWVNCAKCRAELNVVAQQMARECSAGWERFSR